MKKMRPKPLSDINQLLIGSKDLTSARKNTSEDEHRDLQKKLEARVEQYARNISKSITDFKKENLAYTEARLRAFEHDHRRRKKLENLKNEWAFGGAFLEHLNWFLKPTEDNMSKLLKAQAAWLQEKTPDEYPVGSIHSADWLSPMPVWSTGTTPGYCQATGNTRTQIRRFLDSIKAKPMKHKPSGSVGRPSKQYPIKVGLQVLDWWLGNVFTDPRATAVVAGSIGFRTMQFQNETPKGASPTDVKRFKAIIRKHTGRADPLESLKQ